MMTVTAKAAVREAVREVDNKETRRDLKTDNEGNKDAFKWLAIIWRY